MTNRFKVNFFGPDDEFAALYPDEPSTDGPKKTPLSFLRKLSHPAETDEWIFVENSEDPSGTGQLNRGWIKAWAVGEALPDVPQTISARALTFGAVGNELDPATPPELRVSADFLLALFIVENQIDAETELTEDLELAITDSLPDPDFRGGFAVTTAQWDAFLVAEGPRLKWSGDALRELILPQMRCANWLAHRNRRNLGVAFGAPPTEPFLPRMIDLFMAHLIGDVATAAVMQIERAEDGLNRKMRTVVRDANSWSDTSPELVKLFANRAAYLGELDAIGGGLRSVAQFLEACQTRLDPALTLARRMLDTYLPGFAAPPADSGSWLDVAQGELAKWSDGWKEQREPGLSAAKTYFKATDYEPAVVVNRTTNELTHWCGAFVAHCMKEAGAPVPAGSAAAARWRNWGDRSLPAKPNSDIPKGAVVMTGGGKGSNHIGHVTLFNGWTNGGQSFLGLGGNQSDSVTVGTFKTRSIVDIRILADKSRSSDEDLEILAKTLWGEIRGGTDDQVRNVAHVILNRHFAGYRSNGSIAGACLAHKQFSCWNPGTRSLRDIQNLAADNSELLRLMALARQVIDTRRNVAFAPNPLGGARHYHNHHVNPNWAIPAKIVLDDGKHIFYRDIA